MRYLITVIVTLLILVGCTQPGNLPKVNIKVGCTDLRDGEKFNFNTKAITDIKIGYLGAPTTFWFVDSKGRDRMYSSTMEEHIKCLPIKK